MNSSKSNISIPELTPKAFFALRTNVRQNAHFISDFQVLYAAGSVLVIHNYYEKRQKYIKLYDKSLVLSFVAVSPSRKYAAVIENGERGQIIIYDLSTLKRRRILNLPNDSTTTRFETLTFSHDDKLIMAITGEPDWNMVSYNWEKGKVDSSVKAILPNSPATVTQICCHPNDNSEVLIVGNGLFRILTLTETVWRQYGFTKADQLNITTACYLTPERIVCGTVDGRLIFFENGEIRAAFNALTVNVINIREKDEVGTSTSSLTILKKASSEIYTDEDKQVRTLLSFNKGFAYSCKLGYVHLFEKESPTRYRKRNIFRLITNVDPELNIISHLSINVSQDNLLATSNRAQIYTVRLWGPDMIIAPEIPFKIMGEPIHHGEIVGMSMCVWKPIFITGGKIDNTIRIWNFETMTVDMMKYFDEPVYSVAIHPMGIFAAVGFAEKLSFMIILVDDIQSCRDFPISCCPSCRFSSHGQYLSAVNNFVIEIYSCISFENIFCLKGHTDKITAFVWSTDEKKLVSCSEDGLVIEWDMIIGEKIGEVETPGIRHRDCSITSDGKFIYVVGDDGLLREISDSNITRIIEFPQRRLECVVLSRSDMMMFLAVEKGPIISVKIPLTDPAEYLVFHYHFSSIASIRLTYDDETLVTTSFGGTVVIWKLLHTEGKTIPLDKDFSYSKDILINKTQLEQKINLLKDLGVKLFDLEVDHATLVRATENEYSAKMKEIQDSNNAAIQDLKQKIDSVETDQENQLVKINQEVNELKMQQDRERNELESNYGEKLALEFEKLKNLSMEKDEVAEDYERRFTELKVSKELTESEIVEMYEKKIVEVNEKLQESYKELAKNIEVHNAIKQQTEDDADREMVETKAYFEKVLKEEREYNEGLKVEAQNMKKKYVAAQKEIDEQRRKIEFLQSEHQRNQTTIQSLEKDIQDLKKEITERDVTIDDKDKRIFNLQLKIQELEKFKLVLDYKIKELKNQIDPKDREIIEKKEQIEDMEKELENLQKLNTSLELQSKELKEKIVATEKDLKIYEGKQRSTVCILKHMKTDITFLEEHKTDYKLIKDGIKSMYLKYNDDEIIEGHHFETDIQKDFMVQREFLEKTISALKSTLAKKRENKKEDSFKVMEDNVVLVEELNLMRKQLKDTTVKVKKLEGLLGVKPGKCVTPKEAYNKLQACLRKQEAIRKEYKEITESAWEETNDLVIKIANLHERIELLEKTDHLFMREN